MGHDSATCSSHLAGDCGHYIDTIVSDDDLQAPRVFWIQQIE
jgi:hypothetical protein